MRRWIAPAVALALFACPLRPAAAQWFAVPQDAGVTLGVERLQALVLHHDGQEGLLVQAKIRLSGDSAGVRAVVAVLPVPAPALDARRAERGTISPLDDFTAPLFKGAPIKPVASRPAGYQWSPPPSEWGLWHFTKLATRGSAAVDELKAELGKLKVTPPDDARLAEYAKNDWSFVIARYELLSGVNLPTDAELPPFLVTFPSTKVVLPLWLLGAADAVRVYVFSARELAVAPLPERGLMLLEFDTKIQPTWSSLPVSALQDNRRTTYNLLPEAVRRGFDELLKRGPALGPLKDQTLFCYRLYAEPFSSEKWTADVEIGR